MINGIINVYKEQGYTSFDVVAKLRGILKQKKIGHTGTLDPLAEGVLMVCLGKATKLVDMLTGGTKEYKTVMTLGIATDTEDITGKIIEELPVPDTLTNEQIISTIKKYVGVYNQIPPMYSAIKKDGKKLYEYAREGIEIQREAREVEIFSIEDIKVNLPEISFHVHCSKGTYIRSLCRDIGKDLGCCGTMKSLVRSNVKDFKLEDSLKLSQIEELFLRGGLDEYILPIDAMLTDYPRVDINNKYKKLLLNGNTLRSNQFIYENDRIYNNIISNDMMVRVYCDNEILALYRYNSADNIFKPYKMFLG